MIKRKMIKAFAGLEGIELIRHKNVFARKLNTGDLSINGVQYDIYDPIIDLALNCAARDKYRVHTDYINKSCSMWVRGKYSDKMISDVRLVDTDGFPVAVIECILKSEGKWIG